MVMVHDLRGVIDKVKYITLSVVMRESEGVLFKMTQDLLNPETEIELIKSRVRDALRLRDSLNSNINKIHEEDSSQFSVIAKVYAKTFSDKVDAILATNILDTKGV